MIKLIKYVRMGLSLHTVKNEAKVMSKLQHPFIVKYFDDFEIDHFFYIVTEFCRVSS